MGEIVSSMFGPTPMEIQQAQRQAAEQKAYRDSQMSRMQQSDYLMNRAGAGLGGMLGDALGIQNPELAKAQQQQELNKQIDLSTPESIRASAEMLRQKGDFQRAFALSQLADKKEQESLELQSKLAHEKAQTTLANVQATDVPEQRALEARNKLEIQKAKLEQDWKKAMLDSQDKRLTEDQRQESKREADDTKVQLAQLIAATRQAGDKKPNIITDAAGNVTLLDNSGNVIKKIEGGGKPSATYEKIVAAKKQLGNDLDSAITNLEDVIKKDGLIDKSTGSGAGALIDMGAGFFGQSTPGAIAVAELKPIYDKVLKMVPRFEGPQSDKDTRSYEAAAGQLANPSIPNAQKKAAAAIILTLMKQRKSQFTSKDILGTEADSTTPATSSGWGKAVAK